MVRLGRLAAGFELRTGTGVATAALCAAGTNILLRDTLATTIARRTGAGRAGADVFD